MCNAKTRFFFVGIGGIGMSGLAEFLQATGHDVAGSDVSESESVSRLRTQGIPVFLGHSLDAFHAFRPDTVVINSAISPTNPLWESAKSCGMTVLKRGELLAHLMNASTGLVVAGSHGKTTTSSLLADVLHRAGVEASFVIGGRLADTGDNARWGSAEWFVAEGDESDASFLHLWPRILGITNLDADHMSTYQHSVDVLIDRFTTWVLGLPEGGTAVLNSDDAGVQAVVQRVAEREPTFWITRRLCAVGKALPETWKAGVARWVQFESTAQHGRAVTVQFREGTVEYEATLPLIGECNVRNALMAGAMARETGLAWRHLLPALAEYPGVQRRMQYVGEPFGAPTFEDYGHHPTELRASIEGLRTAFPNRRLIHVFQLHRYTRTRDLWTDFVDVLGLADALLLFPIYPASEPEIPGISAEGVVEALKQQGKMGVQFVTSVSAAHAALQSLVNSDDIVLLQGAGDLPRAVWRGERIKTPGIHDA